MLTNTSDALILVVSVLIMTQTMKKLTVSHVCRKNAMVAADLYAVSTVEGYPQRYPNRRHILIF
jgi:hypothetical protein